MTAERLRPHELAPEGAAALVAVEGYIAKSGLGPALVEFVKMRASQINGCAYCLDMHSRTARRHGETEQRLYLRPPGRRRRSTRRASAPRSLGPMQ